MDSNKAAPKRTAQEYSGDRSSGTDFHREDGEK